MAYGNVKYVGDGSTKVFSIPFPYLDITHVKVYVNGVLQNNVTYPTESQVELPVAPTEGAIIAVVRETPKERLVDFQNASILDEKTLDLDSNQMMYIVQESLDKSEDALVVDLDNAYDAQGRRIKNLADPQDDQDAVTKRFADQVLAQAQANADAARASAQAAQVAESNAKSYRDTALAAANTATSAANQAVTEVNNAVNKIRDEGDTQAARTIHEGDTQVARTIHEGDTQVARVQAEGNIQIANAKQQADRAKNEADRAKNEADRAENEANRAKAIADSLDIEDDFYTHVAVQAGLSQLGHVNHAVLTTTIDTAWQGSNAPYIKTQTVNDLLATDTPIVDVVMSGDFETDEARIEAWGYVYRITTADNAITLYATEKPTVPLPIQLKVVR